VSGDAGLRLFAVAEAHSAPAGMATAQNAEIGALAGASTPIYAAAIGDGEPGRSSSSRSSCAPSTTPPTPSRASTPRFRKAGPSPRPLPDRAGSVEGALPCRQRRQTKPSQSDRQDQRLEAGLERHHDPLRRPPRGRQLNHDRHARLHNGSRCSDRQRCSGHGHTSGDGAVGVHPSLSGGARR